MNFLQNASAVAVTVLATLIVCSPATAQTNTQRGATLGGIAGAIAGGIIGENNDEAGAGAAIGGVLGAVAGGTLGNARDREEAMLRSQYQYQQQQRYQAQQPTYAAPRGTVTSADVVQMTRSGLPDTVILNQIQQRGIDRRLEVSDIISLHQQGVREPIIAAMQNARAGSAVSSNPSAAPVVVQPSPVIVEQPYYRSQTVIVPSPRRYYRPAYPRHHRGGSRMGFSFGF